MMGLWSRIQNVSHLAYHEGYNDRSNALLNQATCGGWTVYSICIQACDLSLQLVHPWEGDLTTMTRVAR